MDGHAALTLIGNSVKLLQPRLKGPYEKGGEDEVQELSHDGSRL